LKKIGVKREDIVISTKIFFGPVGGANANGCSRKRLIEGCTNSLKRLQMDYVDVLFASRYDDSTPLEEVCRAMDYLVRKGKTIYWGTSEWKAEQITAANELCDKLRLYKPMVEQPEYNMLHRKRFEVEYAGVFEKYKLGATVWSPLAAGLLTGKYLNDPNATGRIQGMNPRLLDGYYHHSEWFGPEKIEKSRIVFKELEGIAKSLGGTLTQLALAWVLRNKDVSSIICAFTQTSYVEENVKAVEMYKKFTPEIDEKIEKLLGNQPETDFSFGKMRKETSRRYL